MDRFKSNNIDINLADIDLNNKINNKNQQNSSPSKNILNIDNELYKSLYSKIKSDILSELKSDDKSNDSNTNNFNNTIPTQSLSPQRSIPKLNLDNLSSMNQLHNNHYLSSTKHN